MDPLEPEFSIKGPIGLSPNRVAPLITKSSGHVHVTKVPIPQQLDRTLLMGRASPLHSTLYHPLVSSGCGYEALTLECIVANWLFDVDILAGLTGPNRGQSMPMVWSTDDDRIDVLVFVEFA